MPFTTDRKIFVGFLLLTLIPLLLGIVTWQNTEQLARATRDLAETNELVKRLEIFLSKLKDVEVAQREYVLTGDESYVQELQKARGEVESRLLRLSILRADKHWLEHLRDLVPQKFEEIQKTIDLRRSGDTAGASSMLLANRGVQPMDDIRRVVRNMIDEENKQLVEQGAIGNGKLADTAAISALVLMLNAGLIWSLFVQIRRDAQKAHRHNEELETRVQERTLELHRSNEELQQFAYAASHDLKEPMRMISSYASLLQRKHQGHLGEDADMWINHIVDGVRRMNALITGLLDYSRAGEITEDQKQEIDTGDILRAVVGNLEAAISETGAKITHDHLPSIRFEPVRMEQLLQNLIGNALKYRGEASPVVHVTAREERGGIVFSVADNGQGIDPQYQLEIFGIFKRLHGKDVEGSGIGLATCKRIVEEHGGRIWVESAPGKGSAFHFTVPASHTATRAANS